MRLNRGTLLLIVVSVVIIAVMFLLSSQQASAPSTSTPTATANAGPVFPELTDTSKIVRFEADQASDSSKVVMTKDAGGVWTVVEATFAQTLATDQTKASTTANNMATIVALDKFETDNPADFGLDKPAYTLTLTDSDGKTYALKIGNAAVANPRYYVQVNDDTKNVYVLAKDIIDGLIGQIAQPSYVASPTPTASATATANPYSEVEQTATQNAIQQQVYATMTATALGTYAPTAENNTESTAEVTAEATSEAMPSAAAEVTMEASSTPVPPTATAVPPSSTPVPPTATTVPTTEATAEATTSP